MNPPLFEDASGLLQAMQEAFVALRTAQSDYQRALEIRAETELNSDRLLALKQAGRKYAAATHRHANAVMAWLAYVERSQPGMIQAILTRPKHPPD